MKKILIISFGVLLSLLILSSCGSILQGLSESIYRQKDVHLAKDGGPSFLLLVEGLIYSYPKNRQFLVSGIQLFSAYGNAFVKDEERKMIFLEKAKEWGLQLLRTYPVFSRLENAEFDQYKSWLKIINKNNLPEIFWATNAWIMWIIAHTNSMDALIQLPKAKAIIDRIYEIDDSFYYGAPHLFYGIYYSLLPEYAGGNLAKSKEEFDKAIAYSDDKFLLTRLSYAQFYYKAKYDRENFKKLLTEVVEADLDKYPEMRLLNLVSQDQAKELLEQIDDFFYNEDFIK